MTFATVTQLPSRIPEWTFAERARKVRRELGFTQQQMADALEVGLKRYSAWETGKNTPSDIADVAVAFERASGVPRAWFLGWSEADAPRPGGGAGRRGFYFGVGPAGIEPTTSTV